MNRLAPATPRRGGGTADRAACQRKQAGLCDCTLQPQHKGQKEDIRAELAQCSSSMSAGFSRTVIVKPQWKEEIQSFVQTSSCFSLLWKAQKKAQGDLRCLLSDPPASVPKGQPELQPAATKGRSWIRQSKIQWSGSFASKASAYPTREQDWEEFLSSILFVFLFKNSALSFWASPVSQRGSNDTCNYIKQLHGFF